MSKLGDLTYEEFQGIRRRQSVDDLQRLIAAVGLHFEPEPAKSDAPERTWEEEVALEEAVEPVFVPDRAAEAVVPDEPTEKVAPPAKTTPTVEVITGVAAAGPSSQGSTPSKR